MVSVSDGTALSTLVNEFTCAAQFIRTASPERATTPGHRPGVVVGGAGWWGAARVHRPVRDYLIRSKILKMGMYRAMIIDPMMPPSTAIISGSIRAVRASVVASTSWS